MSKTQEKFVQILSEKKRTIGVTPPTLKRWKSGTNSPTLINFDKILKDNEIEPPFFFDGKIESLTAFVKEMAKKMGMEVDINFKA